MKLLRDLRAVGRGLRAARLDRSVYPEDAIERELDRIAPHPVNRLIVLEPLILGAALQYLCGGFRRPAPPGFSYVRNWASAPLLLAAPIFLVPEIVVIDLLLARHPWYWRALDDGLHLYAMLWIIGLLATMRIRPHRLDADLLRLRLGPLRRIEIARGNIAGVAVCPPALSAQRTMRALRREDPATLAFLLDGVPALELRLRAPVVRCDLRGRARNVRRVIVAIDDPPALAAML